ncbi:MULTISPECIES: carbohydrate ABC transporter permease [unclassified Paenibacillus]|uniref:carbohydrate ABC transporter permease n=1 Tax=unclassified Paenibacillus TaxID=185978 RepID=UPI000709BAAC|nr:MULTISPECIES: carbohydrate ABC transporter permease [unclassified Paenibacillus]KQX46766.1 sugar ABC transporter permease [Paenibacillus sp. Root444D2]KRE34211.1 sugar ABC transporter permease [Paenibacillus sp. Soil724D2]
MPKSFTANIGNKLIHMFMILFSLAFIIPFLLVIAVSFSNEESVLKYGYKLIPKDWDLTAYGLIFGNPQQILYAYLTTSVQAVAGMVLGLLVMSTCAYALSRKSFKLRRPIVLFIFFTMLFGGGLIPSYILITQYLHINNTIFVYILPFLANAFYIIILRTFFQGLPDALVESAKMDGASEFRVYWQIILPLSKPALATIGLFVLLDRWNDWFTSLIYIRDTKLYSLQFLLQKILLEIDFLKNSMTYDTNIDNINLYKLPSETLRFAMAIVAAGPLLMVFPFFQKYFSKGLTVGAVKG